MLGRTVNLLSDGEGPRRLKLQVRRGPELLGDIGELLLELQHGFDLASECADHRLTDFAARKAQRLATIGQLDKKLPLVVSGPRPITPFTKPAAMKVAAISAASMTSSRWCAARLRRLGLGMLRPRP